MNKLNKITSILALCTIVGLSCWVGYLLADNQDKVYTINEMEMEINKALYIDSVNYQNHLIDSITISQMPPVEYLDFLKTKKNN